MQNIMNRATVMPHSAGGGERLKPGCKDSPHVAPRRAKQSRERKG